MYIYIYSSTRTSNTAFIWIKTTNDLIRIYERVSDRNRWGANYKFYRQVNFCRRRGPSFFVIYSRTRFYIFAHECFCPQPHPQPTKPPPPHRISTNRVQNVRRPGSLPLKTQEHPSSPARDVPSLRRVKIPAIRPFRACPSGFRTRDVDHYHGYE